MYVRNDTRQHNRRDHTPGEHTHFYLGQSAMRAAELLSNGQYNTHQKARHADVLARLGLKQRDLALLNAIADCRMLDTDQIQRMFFTDYKTPYGCIAATRRALRRLDKHGVLNATKRRVGGALGGSVNNIFTVGNIGASLLANSGKRVDPYMVDITDPFFKHTRGIANLYTDFRVAHNSGELQIVMLETEPYSHRPYDNGKKALETDMYVQTAVQNDGGLELYSWFIEYDRSTEHKAEIVRKLRQYQEYATTMIEQTRLGYFPVVLWVVLDVRRKQELRRIIRETPGVIEKLFVVKTVQSALGYICDPL